MDAKLEALKDLANSSRDVTFAQEFINLDGISLLTQMVESGTEYVLPLSSFPFFYSVFSGSPTSFPSSVLLNAGLPLSLLVSLGFGPGKLSVSQMASYSLYSALLLMQGQ